MRVITIDENNKVREIKDVGKNYIFDANDIQSESGEIGQIMQPDGTFITPEPVPIEPQTTLEDKINYIYYKQMGVI
jgi:hypothetical protein